jgi:hypothetical protein
MATSRSLLMTFLGVVGSSHRDLFDGIDGVVIEVLVCFSDFFFSSFFSLSPSVHISQR